MMTQHAACPSVSGVLSVSFVLLTPLQHEAEERLQLFRLSSLKYPTVKKHCLNIAVKEAGWRSGGIYQV